MPPRGWIALRKGLRVPLVEFSVEHPRWVMVLTGLLSLAALTQFPKVRTDTNPKHMLPETADVRRFNDEVERTFGLYEDTIVLGIVNEGRLLNRDTLERVHRITTEVLRLKGVAARDVASRAPCGDDCPGGPYRQSRRRKDLRLRRGGCGQDPHRRARGDGDLSELRPE